MRGAAARRHGRCRAARTPRSCAAVAALLSVLSLAACGGGGSSAAAPQEAVIRTLAYIVNDCHDSIDGSFGRQRLEVVRGDAEEPITIKELDAFGPLPAFPYCYFAGNNRLGLVLLNVGVFQRLGVSPDGARVVFEVTDDFAVADSDPPFELPAAEEGIFVVNADGSGLRRLAPPSREPPFRASNLAITSLATFFAFSPDGGTVAYTDYGPGPDGEQAVQIVTLNLDTGEPPQQLTRLPPSPPFGADRPATLSPFYLDDTRIAFYSSSNPQGLNPDQQLVPFTIDGEGTLSRGPQPAALSAGSLVPQFAITGPEPSTALLTPTAEPVIGPYGSTILEVFVVEEDNLLQLTNFGIDDITDAFISADRRRVYFNASADPCADGSYPVCTGGNPLHNCQIFSVDLIGGELRQLTAFADGGRSVYGCYYGPADRTDGCAANAVFQDPETGTLVFLSTCNPLGTAPFVGAQFFAMRPDGSGLRQLTALRGLTTDAQGFSVTELAAQSAYSWSPAGVTR